MRCPICNEDVLATEQAEQWGPEWAHSTCVTAYNYGKTDATALQAEQAEPGFVMVPTEIVDRFPEINTSNYDHDDACALNAWGVELVLAARPSEPPKAEHETLMKFYGVSNLSALVEAQAHHVEKLQAKLPRNDQPAFSRVREG